MERTIVRMSPDGFSAFARAIAGPAARQGSRESAEAQGALGVTLAAPELLTDAHDVSELSCGKASLEGARLVGGRALLVNAVDAEAAEWWRRRGFLPSKDDPLVLFRSIADIAASVSTR